MRDSSVENARAFWGVALMTSFWRWRPLRIADGQIRGFWISKTPATFRKAPIRNATMSADACSEGTVPHSHKHPQVRGEQAAFKPRIKARTELPVNRVT